MSASSPTRAFAVEQCKVVTDRMAELTREAIFDAIGLFDGGTYTPEMAVASEAAGNEDRPL